MVGKDNIHRPILQFADDTLRFCKYDDNMFKILIQTFDSSSSVNGVQVCRLIGKICIV